MQKHLTLSLWILLATNLLIADKAIAEADWQLRKDQQGIQIFTREVKGSDFHSFKGMITLDTNLTTLMAVHTDVAYVKEWMKDCDESEMLSELTPTGYTAYFKTNSPWPVKDRDYALQYAIEQDKSNLAVTLSFRSAVGLVPKADDCVRITELEGFWKMEPHGKQRVKVTYQVEADPAGSVPAWLANNFVVDQPFESLKRLRERVKMVKYQNKQFDFIKEP